MTSEEPLVTIAVVPRERFSFAATSLESIYANTDSPFKLIYIDGGSPPYLKKYLEEESRRRGFQLIRTEHLLTQNESRNLAAQHVTTKYIAIIDNDVLVTPGWLKTLVDTAERTGAWVVGPLVLEGPVEKQVVHTVGDEVRFYDDEQGVRRLRKRQALHLQPLAAVQDRIRAGPCDLVEIHAALFNTEKMREIGGWDEELSTNHEHLDFCIRVRQAGGTVYFEPESKVAFVPGPPFKWSDYPFYLLRWNDRWNRHTNRHFYGKFGAQPEPGALARHDIFITDRRRRLALEGGLLRWVRPLLRRKSDGQYRPLAVRLMSRIERWLTRGALKKRQRLLGQRDPSSQRLVLREVGAAPRQARTNATGHIAMFHIGRCGSTVLGDLLNQHPSIHWDGEIYEPGGSVWSKHATDADKADPLGFLRKRVAASTKRHYGCEIKFYQARLVNLSLDTLVAQLTAMNVTHFIVLSRRNYLRKVVSSLVARASSKWHVPSDAAPALQRVRVPVDAVPIDHTSAPLIELLRGYDADLQRLRHLLNGTNALELTYEDDLERDPRAGYQKVCRFLGVPDAPATVRLGRTTPFPLRDVIENFDEVASALHGTPYQSMVDA